MYNGKFKRKKRLLRWNRQFVLMASIVVLLVGAVGGSLAYLTTNTSDVVNTFTPGEVLPTIEETFDGVTKENVKVTNSGNVDAYIRAAVVVNWVDDNGNIVNNPEGHEYEIVWAKTGWDDGGDGYYYYTSAVPADGKTGELITSARPTAGTTYKLQIEILAQSIQSVPTSVVAEKWGVTVADDGTISK